MHKAQMIKKLLQNNTPFSASQVNYILDVLYRAYTADTVEQLVDILIDVSDNYSDPRTIFAHFRAISFEHVGVSCGLSHYYKG